jgi:proteasome lid subunit RPN8/RPN11
MIAEARMTLDAPPDSAVTWPASIEAVVKAEAERQYPEECCGLLFGAADRGIVVAEPIANVESPDRRRAAYLLAPGAYRRADARARAAGLEIVGVFHSHPDHPAEPSPTDLEAAWPEWLYVIVPVAAGRAGAAAGWRLKPDRSGFVPVTLLHPA